MWRARAWWAWGALGLLVGCIEQPMAEQPRYRPDGPGPFFVDGAAERPRVAHTLALGERPGRAPQPPLTRSLVLRGQARYGIYCAPCHGVAGDGRGVIPAHGFPAPPSFHQRRLREAPDAHFYDVITHGHGVMYPYANRVAPAERWAVTAYVRALQLSRHAPAGGAP